MMVWIGKSIPCHYQKKLNPNESKNSFRNLYNTDNAELNQYFYNVYFRFFDRVIFQVEIGKKLTPFTVTQLNTVDAGLFSYQPSSYDRVTSTASPK